MRVLVCGGRTYVDREALYAMLDRLHTEHHFTVLIAGGARGADALAYEWATSRGVPTKVYVADWKLGPKAGPIRNRQMLDDGKPELVIAFPGGKGTAGMVAIARRAGVTVIQPDQRHSPDPQENEDPPGGIAKAFEEFRAA
jgi:hypothetical protein